MTGPYESVIGCEKEAIIERSVKGIMTPLELLKMKESFVQHCFILKETSVQTLKESELIHR